MKRQQIEGFSMQACLDERRVNDRRVQHAKNMAEQNGQRLLTKLMADDLLELKINREADDAAYRNWQRNCLDVIAAADNHPSQRFLWNNDWRKISFLTIRPIKQRKAA